jgi:hypothetical protein
MTEDVAVQTEATVLPASPSALDVKAIIDRLPPIEREALDMRLELSSLERISVVRRGLGLAATMLGLFAINYPGVLDSSGPSQPLRTILNAAFFALFVFKVRAEVRGRILRQRFERLARTGEFGGWEWLPRGAQLLLDQVITYVYIGVGLLAFGAVAMFIAAST